MLHALYVGSLPDLNVGDLVPPSDAKDSLQALDMKGFKGFDMPSVQCPGFTPIQQNRDAHGVVHCNFAADCEVVVE